MIFDTGSSLIYIPTKEYVFITNEIFSTFVCTVNSEDGFTYCPCEPKLSSLDEFPTIWIHSGDSDNQFIFELKGSDYLMYDEYWEECLLTI